jgi:hypothetical protein
VNGVLNWLDRFFSSAADSAVRAYLEVTHWAVRAITSLVFGVFGNAARAWDVMFADAKWFTTQAVALAESVARSAAYTLRVRIPQALRWAERQFARLAAAAAALARDLARAVAALRALVTSTARALTTWVIRHVWAPLDAYARQVRADLVRWGWTAWWWVTHPDKLAAALVFHLAASIEANAWQLAGTLGKFAFSLVLRNAARLAALAESIVTAVI